MNSINLRSSGLFAARAANLLDYLLQFELYSIIFITTNTNTAKRLTLLNIIKLKKLILNIAKKILKNYLNAPISKYKQQKVKLLLQKLSYFPLAIVQAAAYINIRNIMLYNYRL